MLHGIVPDARPDDHPDPNSNPNPNPNPNPTQTLTLNPLTRPDDYHLIRREVLALEGRINASFPGAVRRAIFGLPEVHAEG